MAQGLGNLQPALLLRTGLAHSRPGVQPDSRQRVRGRPRLGKKEQPDRPGLLVNAMLVVSLAFGMVGGLAFLQSIRITAEMFKEPFTAVSEPLKFGSRLEKDTGVNGLSCGTSLDLTVMPADGTYDCRYLDGHGTLHRDATLVVDGTKAGLYNGQGKTMSAD